MSDRGEPTGFMNKTGPLGQGAGTPLLEGTLFAGRYRIGSLLGTGATSAVYRAFDEATQVEVALKIFFKHADADENRERARREVELSWKLNQPNLVRIFDWGEADGILYLVMEICPGGTLRSKIKEGRGLSAEEACRYARDILQALDALHAAGVIHRDVKPDNCFFTADGKLKLGDLGLVRADYWASLTQTGASLGTPKYMAPEAIRNQPAGPAADLYALGITLFEMACGAAPFDGASAMEVASYQLESPPPLKHLDEAGAPKWLRAVIARLLEKDPNDRFASAGAVLQALDKRARLLMPNRKRRAQLALGGSALGLAVVLAATGYVAWSGSREAVSVTVEGGHVTGISRGGARLWNVAFPEGIGEARTFDTRPGARSRFIVISGGWPRAKEAQADSRPKVSIISPRGEQLARIDLLSLFNPYQSQFSDHLFTPAVLLVDDLDADGAPEAVVKLIHYYYPGILYLVSAKSQSCVGGFANSGHIYAVRAEPASDGRKVLLGVGMNNMMGHQTALFTLYHLPGWRASPDMDGQDITPMESYRPIGMPANVKNTDLINQAAPGLFYITGNPLLRFNANLMLSTDADFSQPDGGARTDLLLGQFYTTLRRARGLARGGDVQTAAALFEEARQSALDAPLRLAACVQAARSFREAGRAEMALHFLDDEQAVKINPGEALLQKASCLLLCGHYKEAGETFLPARFQPGFSPWYGLPGYIQALVLNGTSAHDLHDRILANYPQQISWRATRGWILLPDILGGEPEKGLVKLSKMDFQTTEQDSSFDSLLFPQTGQLLISIAEVMAGKAPSAWPDEAAVAQEHDAALSAGLQFLKALRLCHEKPGPASLQRLAASYKELKLLARSEPEALCACAICAYEYGFRAFEAGQQKEGREALKEALRLYPRGGLAAKARGLLRK